MRSALLLSTVCFASVQLHAQLWHFDLGGLGGSGLQGASEPGVAVPSTASGGELSQNYPGSFPSITYNPATKELRLPIGWGSENGFTDLTANYTAWHIHGPVTSSPGDDVNDYMTRSTSPLPGYTFAVPNDQTGDGSRRDASFDTTLILHDVTLGGNLYSIAQQEQDLRDGRWYINVHSAGTYAGGEIRGQLLYVIPEPEHYAAFAGLSLLAFAGYRRFKRNAQPASQSA